MPQARFSISGRVQNVGFRDYVRKTADELGVEGSVWNTRDGRVELVASHSNPMLFEDFVQRLQRGPGDISRIERSEADNARLGPGFEIAPTI